MNTATNIANSALSEGRVLDINQDPEEIKLRQMDEEFISLLPPNFQKVIRQCAKVDGLPIASYFNPLIAYFAQAAGTWFRIKAQAYLNAPNLYLITIGDPSSGKTRGENRFFSSVRDRDNEVQNRSDGAEHTFLESTSHAKMQEVLINSASVIHKVGEIHKYLGKLADSKEEGGAWLHMQLELHTEIDVKRAFRGDGVHQTNSAIFTQLSNTQLKYFLKLYKYEAAGFPQRFLVYPIKEEEKEIPYEASDSDTTPIDVALRAVYDHGKEHTFDLSREKALNERVVDYWNELKGIKRETESCLERELLGKDQANFTKLILVLHIMYMAEAKRSMDSPIPTVIIDKAYKMITLYRKAHIWTYNHCSQLTNGKLKLPTLQQSAAAIIDHLKKKGDDVNIAQLSAITGIDRSYFYASKNPHVI